MTGHFFTFEGGDGSGKTTQSKLFAESINAHWTREPGGTPLGARLREILLDKDEDLAPRAEPLLMAADRSHHVHTLIKPQLASGQTVVCDRYIGSTIAYQGYGRGHEVDWLLDLCDWAAYGLKPDMTFYLQVDPDEALKRMEEKTPDRFESLDKEFHARVLQGYEAQSRYDDWTIIDGNGTISEVHARIRKAYGDFLNWSH